MSQSVVSDFIAINGSFQNYNVIRRLLEGQTPYVDFIPYLGFGHLYLTSLFTFLGGNTFGSSIVACSILTIFIYPLIIYQISLYYFKYNGLIPLFLLMLIICLSNFENMLLCSIMRPGISLRGVRGMILPLSLLLCSTWIRIIKSKFQQYKHKNVLTLCGLSIIAGFSFCWSNDYGICVWLSLFLIVNLIILIRSHSIIKMLESCALMGAGSALAIIITATILTKGHFFAWLQGNFNFSGYMSWYYNIPTNKAYYIFNLDITPITILATGMVTFYIIQIIRNKACDQVITRYGYPCFCLLVSLGATQMYHLFSGGGRPLCEILYIITYLLVLFEIINLCMTFLNSRSNVLQKHIYLFSYLCLFSPVIVITVKTIIHEFNKYFTYPFDTSSYVPELGGKFRFCYSDIIRTSSFIKRHPGRLFSEYASVAEVLSEQFQPSGIDYIIHALSDEARATYMKNLEDSNPKFVTTSREDYIEGRWIRNANWFFHRKIYKDYHIVFRNSYQFFWVKNSPGYENILLTEEDPSVEVKITGHFQTRITIYAPNIKNGIADVKVDYSTKTLPTFSSIFMINSVVGVYSNHSEELLDYYLSKSDRFNTAVIDAWSLRPNSSEYIPIDIIDGKGTVLLESYPNDNTELHVHSVKCERIIVKPELKPLEEYQDNLDL